MEISKTSRIIEQMMGGDAKQFLDVHWRQRILVVRDCLPELRTFYTVKEFLDDYFQVDYHGESLVIDTADGARRFTVPASYSVVSQALKQGSSVALQALRLPPDLAKRPEKWKWMTELHTAICKYFLPGLPLERFLGAPIAAVDVFCTMSASTTGGHYDTGDVFFLPLEGEKEWTVEYHPDDSIAERFYKMQSPAGLDLEPTKETTTVVVSPGDCLYVPPFTYHRVRSTGPSLGVSYGLPSFNAIHLLAHQLSSLVHQSEFTTLLPSAPESEHSAYTTAKREQGRLVRELLQSLLKRLDG
jgi:ribosomal protein L16 Arg81 hydroxylase